MTSNPRLQLSFDGNSVNGLTMPSNTTHQAVPSTSTSASPPFMDPNIVHGQDHDRSGGNTAEAEDSEMEGAGDTAGQSPIPPPPPPHTAPARSMRLADILQGAVGNGDSTLMPLPLENAQQILGSTQELPPPPPPPVYPERANGESNDRGRGEHDDSEDSGDDHGDDTDSSEPWYPIEEDTSEPCQDELDYIIAKGEHSAKDDDYFKQETFFDLEDPELIPNQPGKIQWTVERFNGTKDDPVKELIMRSPTVRIGGYDWQIKVYPRGNGTDYLSVYVECLSLLDQGLIAEEMSDPPLPLIPGSTKLLKRRSVAAQISVIMYNPAEPRVYEFKSDAHQFHTKNTDYGWKYFSHMPRYEFHSRRHGQRQSILKNDRLAFTAHIRTVEDPTGCVWEHADHGNWNSEAITGLRPFHVSSKSSMLLLLLHYRPFREFVYTLGDKKASSPAMKPICDWLYKMLSRTRSSRRPGLSGYRTPSGASSKVDVVENLAKLSASLTREVGPEANFSLEELVPKRLSIESCASVQDAANRCRTLPDDADAGILILELERQSFDSKKRSWKRIADKVRIDDQIEVGSTTYNLHGFITHKGHLQSNMYTPYIQHGGRWYAYEDDRVHCMTRSQAVEKHEGVADAKPSRSDGTDFHNTDPEVAYVLMYVCEHLAAGPEAPERIPTWLAEREKSITPSKTSQRPMLPVPYSSRLSLLETLVARARTLDTVALSELAALQNEEERSDGGGEDTVMSDVDNDEGTNANGGPLPLSHGQIVEALRDEEAFMAALATSNGVANIERSPTRNGGGTGPPLSTYLLERLRKSHEGQPPKDSMASLNATGEVTDDQPSAGKTPTTVKVHELKAKIVIDYFSREYYKGEVIFRSTSQTGSLDTALDLPRYHGYGHRITLSGDEYTGSFSHGKYHGRGNMLYKNGDKYEGAWSTGNHHGHGTFTEARSGNVYTGNFEDGDQSGEGITYWKQSEKDKTRCQICYSAALNTAFYDCGHVVTCQDCAKRVEQCPVCRKRVIGTLRLWYVA